MCKLYWLAFFIMLCSCQSSHNPLHNGRIPFRWMESPPAAASKNKAFTQIASHLAGQANSETIIHQVRPGDLIAFHMSHAEAIAWLKKRTIRKIPYELFRYGHLALVTPDSSQGTWKLLQIALGQTANANDGQEYLRDKSWILFRPQAGEVDLKRLEEFTRTVTGKTTRPPAKYDFYAVLGLCNRGLKPTQPAEIANAFSCTTLVIAAYHYAGYPLHAVHRKGVLDMVTPHQVVEAGR